ncbi:hypothetical protein RB595_004616 [Gaeumannomyces hyphopodioides]
MAPAIKSALPFHRSHSTPDLLTFSTPPLSSPPAPVSSQFLPLSSPALRPATGTPISARSPASCKSPPTLPALDLPFLREDILLDLKSPTVTVSSVPVHSPASNNRDAARKLEGPKSPSARHNSWVPGIKNGANHDEAPSSGSGASQEFAQLSLESPSQVRSGARPVSYADSRQDVWPSRSSSLPHDGEDAGAAVGRQGKLQKKRHSLMGTFSASRSSDALSGTSRALNRASVYLTKIKQRPQAVFGRGGLGPSPTASRSPSPGDYPPETLVVPETTSSVPDTTRPASRTDTSSPDASSTENGTTSGSFGTTAVPSDHRSDTTAAASRAAAPSPTAGDPLESQFDELEAAYHTFASRPTTGHRMIVVKKALVPFLRRYAHDPSNKDTEALGPEDIERRTAILGRWWVALLQILDGRSDRVAWSDAVMAMFPPSCTAQLLGGVDRPALLEAATEIMMRPEWRLSTTYFRPLSERCPAEKVRVRSNSASAPSLGDLRGSAFAARSAEHRIRTMFMSILLAHTALVVDKMSLRHAPLALVKFAGTACAYAFFFVPGVADILVRLWGLDKKLDVVTRVVDELGLPRASKGESEDIVALFPPSIGSLGWTSIRALREKLRRPAKVPLQATQIPWYGPWMSRWRGEDTDLLFVFCKYFYIISEQFVPSGLPLIEKARAPAFVLLHAQLLSIMDNTINRQAAFDAMMRPIPDAFHGADAALTPMAQLLPHTNLLRGMDENCLIVLLRDFLWADDCLVGPRNAFAEAFMLLLKAATKHTRRHDHTCQYILCDFLQEALHVYNGGFDTTPGSDTERCLSPMEGQRRHLDLIDWPFWLDVCKLMLSNNNTMSEIQVLSFVFSTWDIVAADPVRKEALCLDWLLTEEVFASFFTNWCPMVRAYFMRLLCWRICRDRGSPNEVDARIFMAASERLMTVWSHYMWLKQRSEQTRSIPPSTAPSLPQPGKRFMIVRTEVPVLQRGLLASSDSTSSVKSYPGSAGSDDDGSGALTVSDNGDASKPPSASRRWSLLGRVLNISTTGAPAGAVAPGTWKSGGRRRSYDEDLDQARKDLAATRSQAMPASVRLSFEGPPPAPPPKQPAVASPVSDSDSTGSSLVYDASRFIFRFTLHNITWPGGFPIPAKDLILTRPRLPVPSQARVTSRLASMGHRSESPPPPSPGLPPPTRLVSGWAQGGLISGARNAQPLSPGGRSVSPADDPRRSASSGRSDLSGDVKREFTPIGKLPFEALLDTDELFDSRAREPDRQSPEKESRGRQTGGPVRPVGIYETSARYAGRALAEWSLVVSECNSFVDRRREEGILGLGEVEVPALGVEGLRRLT